MNRRNFLLGAGALAVAPSAPAPATGGFVDMPTKCYGFVGETPSEFLLFGTTSRHLAQRIAWNNLIAIAPTRHDVVVDCVYIGDDLVYSASRAPTPAEIGTVQAPAPQKALPPAIAEPAL